MSIVQMRERNIELNSLHHLEKIEQMQHRKDRQKILAQDMLSSISFKVRNLKIDLFLGRMHSNLKEEMWKERRLYQR